MSAPEKNLPAVQTQNRAVTSYEPQGYHGGFTKEDVKIPRIALMQLTSDAVINDKAKFGEFVNSVTDENYGKELELIVLAVSDREIIRGKSLFEDKKLLCSSMNRYEGTGNPGGYCMECPKNQWGPNNEPPECFDQYTYLVFVVGTEDELPAALMLGKTSIGTAKSFNLILKGFFNAVMKGKKAPFGIVYRLYGEKKQNDKGTFYVNKIQKSRAATEEEAELAEGLHDAFSGVDITVDMGDGGEFAATREPGDDSEDAAGGTASEPY